MGYFLVRYNSKVVIYDHRAFIRLATEHFPIGRTQVSQNVILTKEPKCDFINKGGVRVVVVSSLSTIRPIEISVKPGSLLLFRCKSVAML